MRFYLDGNDWEMILGGEPDNRISYVVCEHCGKKLVKKNGYLSYARFDGEEIADTTI